MLMSQTPPGPSPESRTDRLGDLAVISRFAQELMQVPDRAELAGYTVRQVTNNLGFADCTVFFLDTGRKVLTPAAGQGCATGRNGGAAPRVEIPLGEGAAGMAAQRAEPVIIADLAADGSYIPGLDPALSQICVPFCCYGTVAGLIECKDPLPNRFGQEALDLLITVAALVGTRLELLLTEAGLRASQAQLIEAQRIAEIGSWDYDHHADAFHLSGQAARLLGLPDSLPGLSFGGMLNAIRGDDREAVAKAFRTAWDNGLEGSEVSFQATLRGTEMIWLHLRWETECDGHGEPRWSRGTLQNITKRKTTEALLERKSTDLETVLNFMDQGISMFDENFVAVAVNQRSLDLLEFPAERFGAGSSFEDFIRFNAERGEYGPGDIDEMVRSRLALARQLQPHDFERVRPDGTVIEVIGRPTPDGGFVTSYTDITEQKRLERDLSAALREAEEASRAKSSFLATMSHELRTPLNAIMGFAEMLRHQIFGPIGHERYLEYADDIDQSARYLLDLINDLLDLSRIEAGALELTPETFSLGDLIQESLGLIGPRAVNAGITLEPVIPDDLPDLRADRRAIKQILLNLLSNAVKYGPRGTNVAVRTDHSDAWHLLRIEDNGTGIPEAMRSALFKPFGTPVNGHRIAQGGTGLGLSITKSLVELHGGRIDLETESGKGTTVSVSLPSGGPPA